MKSIKIFAFVNPISQCLRKEVPEGYCDSTNEKIFPVIKSMKRYWLSDNFGFQSDI